MRAAPDIRAHVAPVVRSDGPLALGTAAAVAAAWCLALALIIVKPLFVTHDSVSNYAHVWYVQDQLWNHHRLPLSMPVLGHGDALAFPYGFIPWMLSALLWPLAGSWAVTLSLVVGTVGLIAATFWSFPELRHGWWAVATLINPALVAAPLSGQLPFIWAVALLLVAIGCWRRNRRRSATICAGLAQATHAAVVLPLALLLVVCWWPREPQRRRLARCYAISVAIALPAAVLVFISPVVGDTPTSSALANLVGTVSSRGLVLAVPIALVALRRRWVATPTPWLPVACAAAVAALNAALVLPLHMPGAVAALDRRPNTELLRFIDSPKFVPRATYRILRAQDSRIGMYQLLLHHARLDSEFFPESMARQSWPSIEKYSAFLRARHVDFVIIFDNYDRERHTNEHDLLRTLARRRSCGPGSVGARLVDQGAGFDAYRIIRTC
jgi:hypothetical protein